LGGEEADSILLFLLFCWDWELVKDGVVRHKQGACELLFLYINN
jgi:hypothetical protein